MIFLKFYTSKLLYCPKMHARTSLKPLWHFYTRPFGKCHELMTAVFARINTITNSLTKSRGVSSKPDRTVRGKPSKLMRF